MMRVDWCSGEEGGTCGLRCGKQGWDGPQGVSLGGSGVGDWCFLRFPFVEWDLLPCSGSLADVDVECCLGGL